MSEHRYGMIFLSTTVVRFKLIPGNSTGFHLAQVYKARLVEMTEKREGEAMKSSIGNVIAKNQDEAEVQVMTGNRF